MSAPESPRVEPAFRDPGRRGQPRVAVHWPVEARRHGTEESILLSTSDVSLTGLRLEGHTPADLQAIRSPAGTARMVLRIPGQARGCEVTAELRWSLGDPSRSGWCFTRLGPGTRQALSVFFSSPQPDILA